MCVRSRIKNLVFLVRIVIMGTPPQYQHEIHQSGLATSSATRKTPTRRRWPTPVRYQTMMINILVIFLASNCEALHTSAIRLLNMPKINRHAVCLGSIQVKRMPHPTPLHHSFESGFPHRGPTPLRMVLRGGASSLLGGALGFLAAVPPAALASAAAVGILLGLLGGGGSILAVPIFLLVLGHPPKVPRHPSAIAIHTLHSPSIPAL